MAAGSKLYYVKQSQHIQIEPTQWEKDAKHDPAGLSDSAVRWKYSGGEKVSNSRIVKWSDGSMTMHVGSETLELNQSKLPENLHHLFVKQMASDGQPIIEAHGVMTSKLTFKADAKSQTSKKIYRNISSMGKRANDRSEMVTKNVTDLEEQVKALSQQESMRIRGQARSEAHGRRMGGAGDMSADYLEREDDGDIGAIRNNYKRGKYSQRVPNDSAVLQAKRGGGRKRAMDSDSESSSGDSGSPAPRRQAGRKAVSSSSSSSDSGVSGAASDSDEKEMRKSRPGQKPTGKRALDDSDDSD